jgi:mannose-6-phosphate isomerase-like protein (cupin superfamily)
MAHSRYTEARPWGGFEKFVENEACSVKIITVDAGHKLSLQSHRFREEWWIVLDEGMDVEVDGERRTLNRGDDIYIPLGAKHRVFGLGKACRWLEIAFGQFDENDIIRYEDDYGRS